MSPWAPEGRGAASHLAGFGALPRGKCSPCERGHKSLEVTLESKHPCRMYWKVLWERRAGKVPAEKGRCLRRGQCGVMLQAQLGTPKSYVEALAPHVTVVGRGAIKEVIK